MMLYTYAGGSRTALALTIISFPDGADIVYAAIECGRCEIRRIIAVETFSILTLDLLEVFKWKIGIMSKLGGFW